MSDIVIKTPDEIALMRESGRLLARVFQALDGHICAGLSTLEIDRFVEHYIVEELRARPASKGQYGFEFSVNTSLNDVVCHGVPSPSQFLTNGDIVNIDITLEKSGFIADSSKMYGIGRISPLAHQLVNVAYEAMWQGIRTVRPGSTIGDIGHRIQKHAEQHGFSVVREYCGHGIGREMHEAPHILHYGRPNTGIHLEPGMTFTIEPMINQGMHKTRVKKDGWTVVTRDRKLSAQWEHTILVTPTGFDVLTLRGEETQRLYP